ncbi:uncharacterized protein LY79DRAFT_105357 [Colletotrichum navitas]|uniref:Uncharacterized protein n=1 Tax=Colletotrichum navitas TaxID=681940 RepID=A0AAD8UVT7_9PEZI|nr:uncharacterized protein LY79DRAFT_105357 [Colletotrichum navitas]KAK1566132.1 hypothetical protein LY79DRAFT_105357 [Colletotrichum navitas]
MSLESIVDAINNATWEDPSTQAAVDLVSLWDRLVQHHRAEYNSSSRGAESRPTPTEIQLDLARLALEKICPPVLTAACSLRYDRQLQDRSQSSDLKLRARRVAKSFATTPHILYFVLRDGITSHVFLDSLGRLSKRSQPPTLLELATRLHLAYQENSGGDSAIRRKTLLRWGADIWPSKRTKVSYSTDSIRDHPASSFPTPAMPTDTPMAPTPETPRPRTSRRALSGSPSPSISPHQHSSFWDANENAHDDQTMMGISVTPVSTLQPVPKGALPARLSAGPSAVSPINTAPKNIGPLTPVPVQPVKRPHLKAFPKEQSQPLATLPQDNTYRPNKRSCQPLVVD